MASITISDTSPRIQYTATGGQTSFSVPFEFFNATDIVVIHTSSGGVDTTLTYNSNPSTVYLNFKFYHYKTILIIMLNA